MEFFCSRHFRDIFETRILSKFPGKSTFEALFKAKNRRNKLSKQEFPKKLEFFKSKFENGFRDVTNFFRDETILVPSLQKGSFTPKIPANESMLGEKSGGL